MLSPFFTSVNCTIAVQVNGSLARAAIKELLSQGVIRVVSKTHSQEIYTRATNTEA